MQCVKLPTLKQSVFAAAGCDVSESRPAKSSSGRVAATAPPMPLRAAMRRWRSAMSRRSSSAISRCTAAGSAVPKSMRSAADPALLQIEQYQIHIGVTGLGIGEDHRVLRASGHLAVGGQPSAAELAVAIGEHRRGRGIGVGRRAAEIGGAAARQHKGGQCQKDDTRV